MPSKKRISKKPKLVLKEKGQDQQSPKDLEEYIREAGEVKSLTSMRGWEILVRDLELFQNGLAHKLAYLSPQSKDYYESKLLYIAIDKLFSIVNDYHENRDRAIELLTKIENPDMAVTMDVDGE